MNKASDKIESKLRRYLISHSEILFAYLFGSATESVSFRDIDVGVYVADLAAIGDGLNYVLRMGSELELLFDRPVDVVLINKAPDHLVHAISKGKLIINRGDDERARFLTASWSRYFDIEVKRRAYLHAVAGGKGIDEPS